MAQIVVDSGALLALVNSRDKYHQPAAQFVKARISRTYIVPETIFAETMVLTKARLGSEAVIMLVSNYNRASTFSLSL